MNKNSLVVGKGLSLSQAQSISNLCNQRAKDIELQFESINDCEKSIKIGNEDHKLQEGVKIPDNIVELLEEKSKLHACQAFLMVNIKGKDLMLRNVKSSKPDISSVEVPERPLLNKNLRLKNLVDESWGWEQLSTTEINEYLEVEAFAAHIGQFFHCDSILDNLRKGINSIPSVEWMTIETGKKSPVTIQKNHKSSELGELHEKLALKHRKYEQRVNYFKAKVKNLVTQENSRISKENSDLQNEASLSNEKLMSEFTSSLNKANDLIANIKSEFETNKHSQIKDIAAMRINVDERFKPTVDGFLKTLTEE